MNLSIQQLRLVLAIAAAGSFSAAARETRLSQPAVTHAVQQIEQVLGVRLFARTTRRVDLTPEGVEFVGVAQQIVHEFDHSLGRFRSYLDSAHDAVVIGALPSLAVGVLPRLVARYRRQDATTTISVVSANAEEILALIRTGRLDLALTVDPGAIGGLATVPLGEDAMVAVLPQGHPLSGSRSLEWARLGAEPFVLLSADTSVRHLTDGAFALAGVRPEPRLTADSIAAAAALVAEGLGVSAFPRSALPLAGGSGVAAVELVSPLVSRRLVAMMPRAPRPTPAAAAFLEVVLSEYPGSGES